MLLKISGQCGAGCRHCMEDARPNSGQHMTKETFEASLECTKRVEVLAYAALNYKFLLFSGGECTDNPLIVDFLNLIEKNDRFIPLLLTHGAWLFREDERSKMLRKEILRPSRQVMLQVTYDKMYYPKAIPLSYPDERVFFIKGIGSLIPLGRGKALVAKGIAESKKIPSSYNFRAAVRAKKSIPYAVYTLRQAFIQQRGWGNCVPSIDWEGSFRVGETNACYPVGTVYDNNETLTDNILAMKECDRCGLEQKLPPIARRAIGLE